MVNAPNFANLHTYLEEQESLTEMFIHHIDPEEQERLVEMFKTPVSGRLKVDMEKLKDQLIAEVTIPVFAPEERWHVASGTRSRQKPIHRDIQRPRDIGRNSSSFKWTAATTVATHLQLPRTRVYTAPAPQGYCFPCLATLMKKIQSL